MSGRFGPVGPRSTARGICADEPWEDQTVGCDVHDGAGLVADAVGRMVGLPQNIDIAAAWT